QAVLPAPPPAASPAVTEPLTEPAPATPTIQAAPAPTPAAPAMQQAGVEPREAAAIPARREASPPAAAPAIPTTAKPVVEKPAEKKPAVIAALPPAREQLEQHAKPAANSPVGTWSSSEGQMRVEACGKNLCSYAVGGPHAGKMILKHMRQTRDNQWSGQVTD